MTEPVPLHHVWQYTDVDRAFWAEHLEGWVPRRIVDAHTHVVDPACRTVPVTDAKRRQIWVAEVSEPIDAPSAERCHGIVFPHRQVNCVAMGHPSLDYDIEASNDYVATECARRGWQGLVLLRPQWSAERVASELARPGIIGVKPYYAMISPGRDTRDKHLEASIFEFLPHPVLEVLDDRRAWVTLHVPKADRLGHGDNLREVRQIRRRYPHLVLVIAHLGRSYTEPHAREGLLPLAEDDGLYFDNSAVLNPAVHRIAFEHIGWERILYGTDNPVFYMRGRRQWDGRRYVNRTDYPFHFNQQREPPEVEATYTLYLYQALKAIKDVCGEFGLARQEVEAVFCDNARRLIETVLQAKAGWK